MPQSGKSTILAHTIDSVKQVSGFITHEIRQDSQRTGFRVQDSFGRSVVIADTLNQSSHKVGKFFVHTDAFDAFIASMPRPKANQIMYVDEIGQMQLHSPAFREMINDLIKSNKTFMGTVSKIYQDPLIDLANSRYDTVTFDLDIHNRDEIQRVFYEIVTHLDLYMRLTRLKKDYVVSLTKSFLSSYAYDSLVKLYSKAIRYYLEMKVLEKDNKHFRVEGDTDTHTIIEVRQGVYMCDCPLSLGISPFSEKGVCSHMIAVDLYSNQLSIIAPSPLTNR